MKENEYSFNLYGCTAVVYYVPERRPPCCNNPNSPAFSDSGDPEEFFVESIVSEHGDDVFGFVANIFGVENVDEKIKELFLKQLRKHNEN